MSGRGRRQPRCNDDGRQVNTVDGEALPPPPTVAAPTRPLNMQGFWYLATTVGLLEVALALKIVGFMAPLPVQWDWP